VGKWRCDVFKRLLIFAGFAGLTALVVKNVGPDIKRYIRMSRM